MERAEAEAIYDSGREACVEFLVEMTARYERHITRLEARIERLEEQAGQSSRNSSKPPSQDPPKTRQERRRQARAKAKELLRAEGERRKAGGQPGHRGSGRKLAPEDQVDEIVEHYPESCAGCGHDFSEQEHSPSARFGRHQVSELPATSVIVSEHRTHRLCCPHCQVRTAAELPAQLGGSAFGPRLQAAVVTMGAATASRAVTWPNSPGSCSGSSSRSGPSTRSARAARLRLPPRTSGARRRCSPRAP